MVYFLQIFSVQNYSSVLLLLILFGKTKADNITGWVKFKKKMENYQTKLANLEQMGGAKPRIRWRGRGNVGVT